MTGWNVKPWELLVNREREWDRHLAALDELPAQYARRGRVAFDIVAPRLCDFVIARGAHLRDLIAPIVPATVAAVADAAAAGERGFLSFVELKLADALGVVASTGLEVPASSFDHARAVLSAVQTRRDDDRVSYHWARGLAALALDHPPVYRGLIGLAGAPSVPFHPAETFGPNVHGFISHLAGAVESGAPVEACLPAWDELLGLFYDLTKAKSISPACLFWAGWTLHVRLGGQPIGTLAAWLHETLYRAAGVEP